MTTTDKNALLEIGGTGLKQSGGFIWDEFLAKLQGYNGARVYREMMDNDPVVGAILFAISMLVRSAEFKVQPVDDSPQADEARAWLHGALFEDMEHTWEDFMAEVMSMLGFGYALHEIVFKVRKGESKDPRFSSNFSDGTIGVRKLAPRAQESILRWHFNDAGDLLAAEQFLLDRPNPIIPSEKLLHFRTTSTKNNPEGRSVLRPAYIPYLRKKVLEEAEGRAAIRSAGVVVVEMPSEYMSPDADENQRVTYTRLRSAATALAQDRQGSLMLPSDRDESGNKMFDLRYVTADNRRSADMSPIIDRLDKRIAMVVLADFIMLGQNASGGGSYALSSDKTDLFGRAIETFLDGITATVNRRLVSKLWRVNAFDPALQPKLTHGSVQVPDLNTLGNYIQKLAGSGATLFPNDELQDALLSAADLPVTSGTVR